MKLYDVNEFRASEKWPYSVSAGCVVYRKSQSGTEVLLLRREPTHSHNYSTEPSYNLPKGHVAFDETLLTAAERETEEEAGVEVDIQTYLGTKFWDTVHPFHGVNVKKTVHYFAALWKNDLPGIDDEHDEKVWVSPDEAEKLLGKPNPKGEDEIIKRLKDFLELHNEV